MGGLLEQNERWISGMEGSYSCTSEGDVISHKGKERKVLKGAKSYVPARKKRMYHTVCLSIEGKSFNEYVHRLVAKTFLPNPHNLPQVNHKDLDRFNNNVGNLEWCCPSGNIQHAWDNGAYIKTLDDNRALRKEEALKLISGGGVNIPTKYKDLLEDEDFIELGVPPEFRGFTLNRGSFKESWVFVFELLRDCDQGYKLEYLAVKHSIDPSYASKVRSGLRLAPQREVYEKYKNDPHYTGYIISQ